MRLHKSGKRKLGAFFDASFGSCYVAFRRPRDIFRNDIGRDKRRSTSQSVIDGDAMWAIDLATLMELRSGGVTHVFMLMRPQRIIYYAPMKFFDDPDKYRSMNYAPKGGADQRYMPVKYFQAIDFSKKI